MISDDIRIIMKENMPEPEIIDNISNKDSLERLQINSIASIKIIVALEDHFQIEFDNNMLDIGLFDNILQLTEYISGKLETVEN